MHHILKLHGSFIAGTQLLTYVLGQVHYTQLVLDKDDNDHESSYGPSRYHMSSRSWENFKDYLLPFSRLSYQGKKGRRWTCSNANCNVVIKKKIHLFFHIHKAQARVFVAWNALSLWNPYIQVIHRTSPASENAALFGHRKSTRKVEKFTQSKSRMKFHSCRTPPWKFFPFFACTIEWKWTD